MVVLSDNVPVEHCGGRCHRLHHFCGNLGGFIGLYIIGLIKDAIGTFAAAGVYFACSLTLAGLFILTFKKQSPADGVDP